MSPKGCWVFPASTLLRRNLGRLALEVENGFHKSWCDRFCDVATSLTATSNTLPNTGSLNGQALGFGLWCLRCFWISHILHHCMWLFQTGGKSSCNCATSQTWIHKCNWRMWEIQKYYVYTILRSNKKLGEAAFESRPQTHKFCYLFVFSIGDPMFWAYATTLNVVFVLAL